MWAAGVASVGAAVVLSALWAVAYRKRGAWWWLVILVMGASLAVAGVYLFALDGREKLLIAPAACTVATLCSMALLLGRSSQQSGD